MNFVSTFSIHFFSLLAHYSLFMISLSNLFYFPSWIFILTSSLHFLIQLSSPITSLSNTFILSHFLSRLALFVLITFSLIFSSTLFNSHHNFMPTFYTSSLYFLSPLSLLSHHTFSPHSLISVFSLLSQYNFSPFPLSSFSLQFLLYFISILSLLSY